MSKVCFRRTVHMNSIVGNKKRDLKRKRIYPRIFIF